MTPTDIITTKSGLTVQVWQGDCLESLRAMPDESVHCCVTSPPYWGLRDYGCDGQIGLEDTPDQFIEKLVAVFREVRRVLRKDGTCWVNMGDGYASQGGSGKQGGSGQRADRTFTLEREGGTTPPPGMKPKDLIGQPWMLAFALRADGWYLRQDIIWHKPNPMPESVRDRCTKAHEYIFLLTKSARYFYDAEAIAEAGNPQNNRANPSQRSVPGGQTAQGKMDARRGEVDCSTRNKRSVWTVTTRGYPEAHFATFPPKLIEPCIKAGCPEKCCPKCGAPWEREVERTPMEIDRSTRTHPKGRTRSSGTMTKPPTSKTLGFKPTCECGCDPVAGTVLDPFGGSFTTAEVALQLGCNAVMCELNPEYIEMGKRRIAAEAAQGRLFV